MAVARSKIESPLVKSKKKNHEKKVNGKKEKRKRRLDVTSMLFHPSTTFPISATPLKTVGFHSRMRSKAVIAPLLLFKVL